MKTEKTNVQHHVEHLKQKEKRLKNAIKICSILESININPNSVVDIGCGYGFFLAAAQKTWEPEAILGIDGDWVERNQLMFSEEFFWVRDLQKPVRLKERFELAACLEVAEHIRKEHSQSLVDLLVSASDVILFSAAIPGQGGNGHVNEQYPSYWSSRFATRGYVPVDILHPIVWTDKELFPWFRQNLLIYVAESRLSSFPLLAEHRAVPGLLDRVHPHNFQRRLKQVKEARTRVKQLEAELAALGEGAKKDLE